MNRIAAFLVREFREALPPFVFFAVLFHMVALTKAVLLEDYSFTALRATFATVGALIVAKAILVVEALPIAGLRTGRRIVRVTWNVLLFASVALAFRLLEELVPLAWQYASLRTALSRMMDDVHWPLFWVLALWILAGLVLYCVAAELLRAMGSHGMGQFLLKRSDEARGR